METAPPTDWSRRARERRAYFFGSVRFIFTWL